MAYIDGEILAAQQIEQATGFSSLSVGRGTKWVYLNSGASDHYAILHKGAWVQDWNTLREATHTFRTVIEVIQTMATINDNTATDNYDILLNYADAIIARLEAYRKLGDTSGTLRDANITGGEEVKELWLDQGKTLAWIYTAIYLDWSEDEQVTFAE